MGRTASIKVFIRLKLFLLVTVLFGFILASVTEVRVVKAVNVNGCTDIKTAGPYILTQSLDNSAYLYCFNITSSNVLLDCQMNYIDGIRKASSIGVYVHGTSGSPLNNITIQNCRIIDWSDTCITSLYVNSGIIQDANISYSESIGIQLQDVNNLILNKINITKNEAYGIRAVRTAYTNISQVSSTENTNSGIYLVVSHHNIIQNSTFSRHTYYSTTSEGILLAGDASLSDYNQFLNNNISFNSAGIRASDTAINFSNFTSNTIYGNNVGIWFLARSGRSSMFFNNIINNTNNTFIETGYGNNWSIGGLYPGINILGGTFLGGNFWGNYTRGTSHLDRCSDVDWDGICDSANYTIDFNNFDLFPLAAHVTPNVSQGPVISPANPDDNSDLTCYFTVEDRDVGDTLWINVTWRRNSSIVVFNTTFIVTNGTNQSSVLTSANTTTSDTWNCSVTAWDRYNYGTTRSSIALISEGEAPPVYNEYSGNSQSTDLSTIGASNTEVPLVLADNSGAGTIEWILPVTINNSINFDSAVDIGSGYIYVDSVAYSSLNFSANLTINNLTLTNPVILKDGVVCTDCERISYNAITGTLKFNVTGFSNYSSNESSAKDLKINYSDITFYPAVPIEGENFTISAQIWNLGTEDINNTRAEFYADGEAGKILLDNISFSLALNDNITLNSSMIAQIGTNNYTVEVDPPLETLGVISESDENNNMANKSLRIISWHYITGNISGSIGLYGLDNTSIIDWAVTNTSGSKVLVTDMDSSIDFTKLYPMSRTTGGTLVYDDFSDADLLLLMENNSDSLNKSFFSDNQIIESKSFVLRGRTIENVPIVNNTELDNFQTGVLWDSTNDDDGGYDRIDKESIIFVSEGIFQTIGYYGLYDFEIMVPSNLKKYITSDSSNVVIYVELN